MSSTITIAKKDIFDSTAEAKLALTEYVNDKMIPVEYSGEPSGVDQFVDLYNVSHPLRTALEYPINSQWLTGWYIGELINKNITSDNYRIPLNVWITGSDHDMVLSTIKGSTEYMKRVCNVQHQYDCLWHTSCYIPQHLPGSINIQHHVDMKRTNNYNKEWTSFVRNHLHEWVSSLELVILNVPTIRVRKWILINQLLSILNMVKPHTVIIIRMSDARDWGYSEFAIMGILTWMFSSLTINVCPYADRPIYITCKASRGDDGKQHITPFTKAEVQNMLDASRYGYKLRALDSNACVAIAKKIQDIQVSAIEDDASTWCQKYLDQFVQ